MISDELWVGIVLVRAYNDIYLAALFFRKALYVLKLAPAVEFYSILYIAPAYCVTPDFKPG